ncbi:hypothetical protein DPMN_185156 [Dreissena polymorpha]|uniref:Uncharacterized protein n=1 Tax=Dreissena polymorpha TaxID=45954 RepID=A0A9D4DKE9_DREPO|nr:hypothetical protein DPMN_185156 [Dreissena polymorpha]
MENAGVTVPSRAMASRKSILQCLCRTKLTTCSCTESDTHVFSGKYCEVKVEKLQLESKYIVAIASSVGGVVMIVAAVAIVCLVYRLRQKAAKNGDDRFFGVDIALDNLKRSSRTQSENSYEKFRGRHISKEATSNGSIGDLERSEETRVLDGIEHKVTRDDKGNEMFIYQPKQPRDLGRQRQSSVYSSASEDNAHTGSSMYDYIDTETKYQIRRPNVSIRTIRI